MRAGIFLQGPRRFVLAVLVLTGAPRAIGDPVDRGNPAIGAAGPTPSRSAGSIAGRATLDLPAGKDVPTWTVAVITTATTPGPHPFRLDASTTPDRPAASEPAATPVAGPPCSFSPGRQPATGSGGPAPAQPEPKRSFHLLTTAHPERAESYATVTATLQSCTDRVAIYADTNDADRLDRGLVADLLAALDTVILPLADRELGRPRDVDGDGRLAIVLSRRVGSLELPGDPVRGFVRAADFDRELAPPFGNRADLIVLDAGLRRGPLARTVLAHEYAHAVLAGRKGFDDHGVRVGPGEASWLDEAVAHGFEELCGFSMANLDDRIRAFRDEPERYSLVVDDDFADDLTRSRGHRGAAFLFLSWCRRTICPDVLRRIATQDACGVAAVEAATGLRFGDLLGRWALDMARDGATVARPPGGATHRWAASGTTFHAVRLPAPRSGSLRVEVAGPSDVEFRIVATPDPDPAGCPTTRGPAKLGGIGEGRAARPAGPAQGSIQEAAR